MVIKNIKADNRCQEKQFSDRKRGRNQLIQSKMHDISFQFNLSF